MKILWVRAGGFLPADAGGRIHSLNSLKLLSRLHEVTAFTFCPAPVAKLHAVLDEFCRSVCVPLPVPSRRGFADYALLARTLLAGRAYTIWKYYQYPELRRAFSEVVRKQSFDLILCDSVHAAPLIDWRLPCPKVLFTHNVEAQVYLRHGQISSNPLTKAACRLESCGIAREERRYLALADHVVAISEVLRDAFARQIGPERISVVFNGVDTDYFQPSVDPPDRDAVVYTAAMDWLPNEDAVLYFVNAILPLVRREIPSAVFWGVGRKPSRRLRELASGSVRITGTVPDVRPYLDRAAVCVVPIRSASGIRVKIVEALAAGKAVVSTTLGAEGLRVTHEENVLLADTPEDFARQTVRCMKDPELCRRLGSAGREMVLRYHGWKAAGEDLSKVLESVSRNSGPR